MAKTDQDQKKAKDAETEAKLKRLKQTFGEIEKLYGKGTIMRCGSDGKISVPAISTGAMSLDLALGIGGIPRSRITEVFGHESSGKSTLCHHVVANAQRTGGMCALIDTENAFDPTYAGVCGVNTSELYISQPNCAEDALGVAESLVRSDAVDVVIIDSVAGLVPRAEIEGMMGDSHVGLQARLMSQAMRKLTSAMTSSRAAVIFTNQIRQKIGVMFGNPETTTGGNALKFYASIRIELRRKEPIKLPSGEVVGNMVRAKVVKNKLAAPFRSADFDIIYTRGIDWEGSVLNLAIERGVVEKRGAWFSIGSMQLGQGREAAIDFLRSNPDQRAAVEEAVRKAAAPVKQGEGDASAEDAGDAAGQAGGEEPPATA